MFEHYERLVENLVGRLHGPMTFRLILQPLMACIFAVRDGMKDAKDHKPAYFWAVVVDSEHRRELLRSGWKAILKIFVVALLIDAVYQWKVVRWFYPGEALIIATLLAFIPYLFLRGPVNRIARKLRHSSQDKSHV